MNSVSCPTAWQKPKTRLQVAAALSFLAFFTPSWIYLHEHLSATIDLSKIVSGASMKIEGSASFAVGVWYPHHSKETTTTQFLNGQPTKTTHVSDSDSKPYASDRSEICDPRNPDTGLPEPIPDNCDALPSASQPGCEASLKICGSHFRAASAFSFLQGAAAWAAASVDLTCGKTSAARQQATVLLALASTCAGFLAWVLVADVNRLLNKVGDLDEPELDPSVDLDMSTTAYALPFFGFWFCFSSMVITALTVWRMRTGRYGRDEVATAGGTGGGELLHNGSGGAAALDDAYTEL